MKKIFLFAMFLFLALAENTLAQEFNIPRPVWLIGDTWTWIGTGAKAHTVLGSKNVRGFEAYEVESGATRIHFTKDLSHIQKTDKSGKILYVDDPPMKYWDWPLKPNKKWHQNVYWIDRQSGDSNTITHWSKIASQSLEKIRVPAGEFEAVRVIREAGAWRYEYWYSPEVKNYVKWVTERGDGAKSDSELRDYKIGGPVENLFIKEPVIWPAEPKVEEYCWIILKFSSPSDIVKVECEMTFDKDGNIQNRRESLDLTKDSKYKNKTSGTVTWRWKFSFAGKREFKIWVVDGKGEKSNTIILTLIIIPSG